MIRALVLWFLHWDPPQYVAGWNAVRADQAAAATARILLGSCGPARPDPTAAQRKRRERTV